MCLATLRMRTMFATDVPPNFNTRRDIGLRPYPSGRLEFVQKMSPARAVPADIHANAGAASQRNLAMPSQETLHDDPTVDPEEINRFDRLGAQCWDPEGPMRALHKFNPVRVAYLRELLCRPFSPD